MKPVKGRREPSLRARVRKFWHRSFTAKNVLQFAECSADTALRDIQNLVARIILVKAAVGGRSTSYALAAVTQ